MTREDINKYAYIDQMPREELTCPERCLFYALRDVYRAYKTGRIDKATGEAQKGSAMHQYSIDCGNVEFADKLLKHNASMWKRIESAAARYHAERTLENADAFIEAVYNAKLKGGDSYGKSGE